MPAETTTPTGRKAGKEATMAATLTSTEVVTYDNTRFIRGTACTHLVATKDGSLRRFYENGRMVATMERTEGVYVASREGEARTFPQSRNGLSAALAFTRGAK